LSTVTAVAPARSTIDCMRPPNTPLMQMTAVSPGSSRLLRLASIPIVPGADITNVSGLAVR